MTTELDKVPHPRQAITKQASDVKRKVASPSSSMISESPKWQRSKPEEAERAVSKEVAGTLKPAHVMRDGMQEPKNAPERPVEALGLGRRPRPRIRQAPPRFPIRSKHNRKGIPRPESAWKPLAFDPALPGSLSPLQVILKRGLNRS